MKRGKWEQDKKGLVASSNIELAQNWMLGIVQEEGIGLPVPRQNRSGKLTVYS